MKAVNCSRYGSSDVLKLIETEKPEPKDDEVLIKIQAASINSRDWCIMRGSPFPIRLNEGLFSPKKNKILGSDVAGTVEAVGKNINKFAIGDEVYGCLGGNGDGGFSEYVCAKETLFAPIAKGLTMEQAAAVPMAAVTALQGLRDFGGIKQDHKVLVNGAGGGVGTYAVQLAKAFGAEVTGVCSKQKMELVRSLGAEHVIDYEKQDYTQAGKQYDLVLDVVANHSLKDCRRILKPGGTFVVVKYSTLGFAMQIMLLGKRTVKKDGKKVILMIADNSKSQDLIFLNELFEAGKITSVIDSCYTLTDIQKAFESFEKEHPRGKIVITALEVGTEG